MFWLAVASDDAPAAAQVLHDEERASMTDEQRRAADAVNALGEDDNTCPACFGTIPRGEARCPECGLRFS